jgi:hypothetical protein
LWKDWYGIGKARNFFDQIDPIRHAGVRSVLAFGRQVSYDYRGSSQTLRRELNGRNVR